MKLAALAGLALIGCAVPEEPVNPNEGMLRDFVDGKFDSAGHPLNARVTEAETLCPSGRLPCQGAIAGTEQHGDLVASLRLRVRNHSGSGTLVTASIKDANGQTLATHTLTTTQLRHTSWFDLPLAWSSSGAPVTVEVIAGAGARVELDYVEVFPQRFGLVASPGSGIFADTDKLTFELPKLRKLDRIELDGVDITARITQLQQQGKATRTTTEFRTIYEVAVGDLAIDRMSLSELELRAGSFAARMQLRRSTTPCTYEGDPNGTKILVTGFQPFPADGWHENVSAVAVSSLEPSQLRGVQVMRVVMPVEYDRAAAQVTDMISRCAPDAVISFGQGGSAIALEQVAYNLQDTGEISGGVPDNRGIIRAAQQIDPAAPAQRDTLLPLEEIEEALVAIGEDPAYSRDPGRYICNNVMFAGLGAIAPRGGISGFIHLPYTTEFDVETRQRYGNVVRAAVQATADSLR